MTYVSHAQLSAARTRRRRPGRIVGVAALTLTLALAGCSGDDGAATSPSPSSASASAAPGSGSTSTSAAPADVMFAQMMIPHHEQAVELAALAADRASDPFVVDLAAAIAGAQQPEIDQMSAWLAEWGAPRQTMAEVIAGHGAHGMSGVVTEEQLAELTAASGAEFDRLFAARMIEHHEGAIEMAQAVVGSSDPRVAELAAAIITVQQEEIDAMREFLDGA